jgi:glutamine synthetase
MKNALELADKLYMSVNIFDEEHKDILDKLEYLPQSCWESAEKLIEKRQHFENNNVFPAGLIEQTAENLKSFDDKDLSERLYGKEKELRELVNKYLHWQ